jgi:hypothetical protein
MERIDIEAELKICEAGIAEPWRMHTAEFLAHARVNYPELLLRFKRLREMFDSRVICASRHLCPEGVAEINQLLQLDSEPTP